MSGVGPRVIHTGQALIDAVIEVPTLPARGQNVMATSITRYAGGSVNVLLAAARSGAAGVQAGSVGTGPNGDLIRAALAAEGVAVCSPPIADLDSGVCVVMVEPSAERTFVTTLGAERHLTVASLATSEPAAGDLVCVSGYTLVMPQTRDPLLAFLGRLAPGVVVVLDPGAPFAALPPAIRDAMLATTQVWTSNLDEARGFVRAGHPGRVDERGIATMDRAALAVGALLPGAVVIVRDGPKGCALVRDGELVVAAGFPQTPVDTNGAGDCHTGVLLAEVAAGRGWAEAVRRANAAAAIKVTRRGPATAPRSGEVDAFLASLAG